jgi:hypothetical protein
LFLDIQIIGITAAAIFSRAVALRGIQRVLEGLGADEQLREVARREQTLVPAPPPGSDKVVVSRDPSAQFG